VCVVVRIAVWVVVCAGPPTSFEIEQVSLSSMLVHWQNVVQSVVQCVLQCVLQGVMQCVLVLLRLLKQNQ